jgi:phosphosulfolactate synthase
MKRGVNMRGNEIPFWPASWMDPSLQRAEKPRTQGLTMVIDKGLGLHAFHDLLQLAAPYIDICKLGFGTSALYPVSVLQEKVEIARSYDIDIMPGGTFFELAFAQAPLDSYLARLKAIGFNAIEISDGTLPLSREQRTRSINRAAEEGLKVYAEFGQKAEGFKAEVEALASTLAADLQAGAEYIIVEARESGNVGIFNQKGELDVQFLHDATAACGDQAKKLIWEAPRKEQQVALLCTLGFDVNLGNVAAADVFSVETLRRGLRGDTSARVLRARRAEPCE